MHTYIPTCMHMYIHTKNMYIHMQVIFHPGPKMAMVLPFPETEVTSLHHEYGDLECTIELVNNLQEAIDVINTHGSAHTDTIITEDGMK